MRLLTPSHAEFRQRSRFGSLDGLRALSVLAVIWHHTGRHGDSLPHLLASGHHGVTLFFAISGFLIVTLLLREHESHGRIDLKAFYMRRTLRIFPLYYATLLLYVVLVLVLERQSVAGQEFFRNLIFFATYTSNWFVALDGRVIFYFAWSLAAEEQFYLLWPSVQRWVKPLTAALSMVAFIAFIAWVQWGAPANPPPGTPLWQVILLKVPLAICLGVALAHALHSAATHGVAGWVFGWRASSPVLLAIFLAVLSWRGHPEWLVHLCAVMVVGACVYREDHGLAMLLRWKPMAYLGTISYGMYLLHQLARNAVAKALGAVGLGDSILLLFLLTSAATVLAATISFRYFESYFLRKKVRYSTRPSSEGEAAPAVRAETAAKPLV